jgi:hypothetical protein
MRFPESQKQYWTVKSNYRDTIIFFKVGKFYELYEVRLQPNLKSLDCNCIWLTISWSWLDDLWCMHAITLCTT